MNWWDINKECNKMFKGHYDINKHIKDQHYLKKDKIKSIKASKSNKKVIIANKIFKCEQC